MKHQNERPYYVLTNEFILSVSLIYDNEYVIVNITTYNTYMCCNMMKEIRIMRTSKSCSPSLQTASLCSSLHSGCLQCKERNQSMFYGALASPRKWSLRVINYSELTCRTSLTRVDIYYSPQPSLRH